MCFSSVLEAISRLFWSPQLKETRKSYHTIDTLRSNEIVRRFARAHFDLAEHLQSVDCDFPLGRVVTVDWPDVSLVFIGYKNGQISCTVNDYGEELTDEAIKPLFNDVHKDAVLAMGACRVGRYVRLASVDEKQEVVLSLFSIATRKFAIAQRMVTTVDLPLHVVVSMGARRSGSKQFFVLVVGADGMESVHLCKRRIVAFHFCNHKWCALRLGRPPVSLFELTAAHMSLDYVLFGGTSDGRVVVWRELPEKPEADMDEAYDGNCFSTSDATLMEDMLIEATELPATKAYVVHRVGDCGILGGAVRLLFSQPRDPRMFGLSEKGDLFYIVKLPYEADRWQSYVVPYKEKLSEMLSLPATDRVADIRFWPHLTRQMMAVVESETGPYLLEMHCRRRWPLPGIRGGGGKGKGAKNSSEYTMMPSGQLLGVPNNTLCEYLMPEADTSFVTGTCCLVSKIVCVAPVAHDTSGCRLSIALERGCLDSNIVSVAHVASLDIVTCITEHGQVALFHFDSTRGLTTPLAMAFLPRGTLATCAYSIQLAPTEADMTDWIAFLLIGTADGRIYWVNVTDVHLFGNENSMPLSARELNNRQETYPIKDIAFVRQEEEIADSISETGEMMIEHDGGTVVILVEWDARKCRLSSKECARIPRKATFFLKVVTRVFCPPLPDETWKSQLMIDTLRGNYNIQRLIVSCEEVLEDAGYYRGDDCDFPLGCLATVDCPDMLLVFLGYKNGKINCTVNIFREKLSDDAVKPHFNDFHKAAILAMGACQAGSYARLVSVDENQEIILSLFSIATRKFTIIQRMATSVERPLHVVVSDSESKQFFVLVVGADGMERVCLCQ